MKGLSVVLVVLLVVTGVAVTGSRAQPPLRPTPLVGICEPTGPIAMESRCKPIGVLPTVGEMEQVTGDTAGNLAGDTAGFGANEAGGDYSDPEFLAAVAVGFGTNLARVAIYAAVGYLVDKTMDWAFGGDAPSNQQPMAYLDMAIFDPHD